MMCAQTDRVASYWQEAEQVDMLVEGRKIALLIIMHALFSVDFWSEMPRMWRPILKAIQFISPGAWILWRGIPRPGYRRYLQTLDTYLFSIITVRRQSSPQKDMLQHLIDAGLNDDCIRDQMLTMLIAGHDTSTALLAWTFALLGQNPEVHRQLVSQLHDSLAGKAPDSPSGWQPQLLDGVIKESLRLYPPIHLSNRMVAEELDFGDGQIVPAEERLFCSIYLTHRDPSAWENPSEFDPERFAHGRKTPPMAYIPFGGGPRACIGSAFGLAEARVVVARLLQTYSFEAIDPQKVHAHMGATLEPRPGVFVRVHRRPTPL
jgi:cytochrome P450